MSGAGPAGSLSRARAWLATLGAWDLVVLGVVALVPVVFVAQVDGSFWAPKVAVSLLLLGPGLVALGCQALGHRSWREPAWWAWGFLLAIWLSAALADVPLMSVLGIFNTGTGAIALTVAVAAWACARQMTPPGRRALPGVVIGVALLNAAVALIQGFVKIPVSGLDALYDGRPSAFMGNPVFLSALLAAALAMLAAMVARRPRSWWLVGAIAMVTTALNVAGGRSGLVVGVLAAVGLALPRGSRALLTITGAIVVGMALSVAVPLDTTAVARTSEVASAGVSPRTEMWRHGVDAWSERPLLGWGPGRFQAATAPRITLDFAHASPGLYYADAHNLAVELLTTTGLVGVVAIGGFAVTSVGSWWSTRRRRDVATVGEAEDLEVGAVAADGADGRDRADPRDVALVGAAALAACLLLEPQAPSLVPPLFVLLGAAAAPAAALPRFAQRGAVAAGLVAAVAASLLMVGLYELAQAQGKIDRHRGERAARILPPWPQVDVARFDIDRVAYLATGEPSLRDDLLRTARAAREADPAFPTGHEKWAQALAIAGRHREAVRAYQQTLKVAPYDVSALAGQILAAREAGMEAEEREATRTLCQMSADLCELTR